MPLLYIAPSPELAVELGEVRADAAALADAFSQLNAPLPVDFPKGAVIELATALHDLPNGTAKGCLRPLNEAQAQLATIRSQHIHHDHPVEASIEDFQVVQQLIGLYYLRMDKKWASQLPHGSKERLTIVLE
jgi:hypothetical protein